MTVSSSVNKVIYSGNSATVLFPVSYYFLENSHLKVILRAADGTETVQALTTNYTVTGAGNPAGGSVTMLVAPPTGTTLTIVRNVPATQETDYLANDPFPAESHERALDKLTMLVQENEEVASRALVVPASTPTTVNTTLPNPSPLGILAWNQNANAINYISPSDIGTAVAYATAYADTFDCDGVDQTFTLTANPVVINNLDVSINGSTQVPNVDYTLSGTTLTMTTPPPVNSVLLAKYSQGLPNFSGDSQDIRYVPAGTGAVQTTVQAKLRETVSVKDFGAVGDGVTDDTVAFQNAAATKKPLWMPQGDYIVSQPVVFESGLFGAGAGDSNVSGKTKITLTGTGQLVVAEWFCNWDGFEVRSAVNGKTLIKNQGVSYWTFTNFVIAKIGAATNQIGIDFDTSTASIYFARLDNTNIRCDYPIRISGNGTQVFNANKIGMGVGGNKWFDFLSAITVDAGVLACDANEFGGYFESGTNIITFNGVALRQNRFRLILDFVTRVWNSTVVVNDTNIWEILDGGFTLTGTRPQNQIFIGPPSTKIRATDTSSTAALVSGAVTTMTFDGAQFDTLSEFSNGLGLFEPKYAGYYEVDAQALTQAYTWPSGTRFEVQIFKNGSLYASGMYNASETASAVNIQRSGSITSIVYMNGTTDTLEIKLVQNSGGNVSLATSPTYNFINISRLS